MKACLAAINSKYIHTSPAVDSLRAFSLAAGCSCEVQSFTINQPEEQILGRLFEVRADVYFFSVYIWNCETVYRLRRELSKLLPKAEIWYGGPEVSFQSEKLLEEHKEVRGILRGEGEETFLELLQRVYGGDRPVWQGLKEIKGITYREEIPCKEPGTCLDQNRAPGLRFNPDRPPMDLDRLVFPYYGTEPDPNRIYYYESSRGCPFGCTYCLSSVDKSLRFKSLQKVYKELGWFLKHQVRQVKFVDRTFNLPSQDHRAMEIWRFLKEHDNGVTNFHFEVCGELLSQEELEFLSTLRPGQVQFEIGVQTWNPETLQAIHRSREEEKLQKNVAALIAGKNIHIHLDLIAGLPFENLVSFEKSFDRVYALNPLQLQLGFLKVLKGTPMEGFANDHGFLYTSHAPYEVLSTPWLSYEGVLELKAVEEMTEVYYNSHQFEKTVHELLGELEYRENCPGGGTSGFVSKRREADQIEIYRQKKEKQPAPAYRMYRKLAEFYQRKGYDRMDHSRMDRYRILLEFIESLGFDKETYIPLLLEDALSRERLKHWPEWAGKREKPEGFDYEHRDPLTGNAQRYPESCGHA